MKMEWKKWTDKWIWNGQWMEWMEWNGFTNKWNGMDSDGME